MGEEYLIDAVHRITAAIVKAMKKGKTANFQVSELGKRPVS